jgi:hypothetical protein
VSGSRYWKNDPDLLLPSVSCSEKNDFYYFYSSAVSCSETERLFQG